MANFNFTTGPATLPDVGELSYNGCVFSPLFATEVSGNFVKDAANRTVKEIEYSITVDGYVTLPSGEINVETTLAALERLLSAPAGALVYRGRGVKIAVNTAGGDRDTAWGPLPEILEITPMGNGGSAHIKWRVKTRIPPRLQRQPSGRVDLGPVLQFNYATNVSYNEDGYSSLKLDGTLEIPLTRRTQNNRVLTQTVDDFRQQYMDALIGGIDLTRFRVTRRDFPISRDKRTLEFHVEAEELPWMAMPPDVTIARGQFSFRPVKAGVGLCNWLCTLSVTYTVAKTATRRTAWAAFLALLRVRMEAGNLFAVPQPNGNQNPGLGVLAQLFGANNAGLANAGQFFGGANAGLAAMLRPAQGIRRKKSRKVFLVDLSGNEGLHLDSKTVTFSATWRLVTVFSEILLASGLWRKVPSQNENVWAASMRSVSGSQSWLANKLDPAAEVIVDFGA